MEKEKLEREKQKLKLLFKQKKLEASELEEKINQINGNPKKTVQVREKFLLVPLRKISSLGEQSETLRFRPSQSADVSLDAVESLQFVERRRWVFSDETKRSRQSEATAGPSKDDSASFLIVSLSVGRIRR